MAFVLFQKKIQLKSPSRVGATNTETPGTLTSYKANNMDFSINLAKALIESTEEFPVDLEQAWVWLGYSKKQNAKDKLTRNFDKDADYIITQMRVNPNQQGIQGGRPSEQIRLTIECFKSLGMMAGTEQGKQIRKYFLECEKIAKQAQQPSRLSLGASKKYMPRAK